MTFEEKFAKIRDKFLEGDTAVLDEEFAIQVNMTNDDCGGTFYIANIDNTFSVEPYDYRDHTAMITASADDITKFFAGRLNLDNGIASGRFAVEGNAEHIKCAAAVYPKPAKRVSVKKTTEKTRKSNTKKQK